MLRALGLHLGKLCLNTPSYATRTQYRTLFTKDFLGVTVFLDKKKFVLQQFTDQNQDVKAFRQGIKDLGISQEVLDPTKDPGVKALLSDDVRKMIYTTSTPEDIEETKDILKNFILNSPSDNVIFQRKKGYLWKDFMALCYTFKALEPAQSLWSDPEFREKVVFIDPQSGQLSLNMPAIADIYLDMLYEKKKYNEVIEEVLNLKEQLIETPTFILIIGMMSCLQINTPASLQKAMIILSGDHSDKLMRNTRIAHPYSLLACLQGNYGLAFEALSFVPKKSIIRTSLLVHVLCKLERVSDAINLLEGIVRETEAEDRPVAPTMMVFPVETVTSLTKSVELLGDKAMKVKLASIFSRLDKIASISQKSLFDVVTVEIDCSKSMKLRREKNRNRIMKSKTLVADEEDLELNDDIDHRNVL